MRLMLALAALAIAAPAVAQEMPAAASCPANGPAPALPAELAGWTKPTPLAAAASPADAGKAMLKVGQATEATLPSTGSVTYALRPEKPGGSVSYGGVFGLQVDKPGTYVVAISSGAWLDVIRDGKGLDSVAHGRGPACTSLRKMVDFPLQPGRYLVQVSANGEPKLGIMVAARP